MAQVFEMKRSSYRWRTYKAPDNKAHYVNLFRQVCEVVDSLIDEIDHMEHFEHEMSATLSWNYNGRSDNRFVGRAYPRQHFLRFSKKRPKQHIQVYLKRFWDDETFVFVNAHEWGHILHYLMIDVAHSEGRDEDANMLYNLYSVYETRENFANLFAVLIMERMGYHNEKPKVGDFVEEYTGHLHAWHEGQRETQYRQKVRVGQHVSTIVDVKRNMGYSLIKDGFEDVAILEDFYGNLMEVPVNILKVYQVKPIDLENFQYWNDVSVSRTPDEKARITNWMQRAEAALENEV